MSSMPRFQAYLAPALVAITLATPLGCTSGRSGLSAASGGTPTGSEGAGTGGAAAVSVGNGGAPLPSSGGVSTAGAASAGTAGTGGLAGALNDPPRQDYASKVNPWIETNKGRWFFSRWTRSTTRAAPSRSRPRTTPQTTCTSSPPL